MKSAIFVELGPGARFVAPRRSRNSPRVIQPRRVTTSCSIIEMWAAGPPKAVAPSRRKSAARSFGSVRLEGAIAPIMAGRGRRRGHTKMTRVIGGTLAHYRISEQLGEGGK